MWGRQKKTYTNECFWGNKVTINFYLIGQLFWLMKNDNGYSVFLYNVRNVYVCCKIFSNPQICLSFRFTSFNSYIQLPLTRYALVIRFWIIAAGKLRFCTFMPRYMCWICFRGHVDLPTISIDEPCRYLLHSTRFIFYGYSIFLLLFNWYKVSFFC